MRLALFLLVVMALLMAGVSNLLIRHDPELASRTNPLNTEARIAWLNAMLGRSAGNLSPQALRELQEQARDIMRLSPRDARGYSLLGIVRLRQGRREEAHALFATALEKAPTEHNALLQVLSRAMQAGDLRAAVRHLDILLRRWPQDLERVRGVFRLLTASPQGARLLSETLAANPPWRARAVRMLAADPAGLALLQQMLLQAAANGQPAPREELTIVINALLRSGDVAGAYRTFVFTLPPQRRRDLGHVFNAAFRAPPSGLPFDWRIHRRSGMELLLPWRGGAGAAGGLRVSFHDAPVPLGNVWQLLSLPPGAYELRARVSARSLRAPRKLYWRLRCASGGSDGVVLARLEIPEGNHADRSLATRFSVPANCPLQRLDLANDLRLRTWTARYRGEVIFHEVRVVAVQQGK